MLKGLFKLSWIEMKIFVREPMGVIGSLLLPVLLFVFVGRALRFSPRGGAGIPVSRLPFNIAILTALLISLGAVQSLVGIMAIYREGGILKRLRATPLSPVTILGSHVMVKLGFTLVALVLMILAGRRVLPDAMPASGVSFVAAVLLGTTSILSFGFVMASLVRSARFAQVLGATLTYVMLALSGVFFPVDRLPRWLQFVANSLPTTHAVTLMRAIWAGEPWMTQLATVGALAVIFAACIGFSARWFRWE
ncbi:MAG: ABC transporter permease [Gemmatimonadetes bacterium]|nr:MAG: ABC transporter permease [Gemmatimonadota bacterium]